jgi:hypothetical protein
MKKITKEQLDEFLKCSNSFSYFCAKYIQLENYDNQVIFEPSVMQNNLIEFITREKYVIVKKERQRGFTSILSGYCAWLTIFFSDLTIGNISVNNLSAVDFVKSTLNILTNLPSFMKPKIIKYNKHSYVLDNGSKLVSNYINQHSPTNIFMATTISFLIIDEAAFIKNMDLVWCSIVPCLHTVHKVMKERNLPYGCVILSTINEQNEIGKWFNDKYNDATTNSNSLFKPFLEGVFK